MSNDKSNIEPSLQSLKSGDRAAFAQLMDVYSGKIYRLALKVLNNEQDAEDVLQETFLKAYRNIQGFEGRSSLATWLYRIAINEAFMLLRKQSAGTPVSVDDVMDESGEDQEPLQIIDWCCLPESELLSTESRQHIDEAIAQLSPALRVVFLLRDVEGLSVKETAEALSINEPVVKTRLLRARLKLRDYLSRYFGERMTEIEP